MEDDLKVLNSRSRYIQLGRIKALLNEVKRKVEAKEPNKKWHYLPIYEYKFKKFGIFQPDSVQFKTETLIPVDGNLIPTSPAHSDTLVLDNDEDDQSYHDSDQEDLEPPIYHIDL